MTKNSGSLSLSLEILLLLSVSSLLTSILTPPPSPPLFPSLSFSVTLPLSFFHSHTLSPSLFLSSYLSLSFTLTLLFFLSSTGSPPTSQPDICCLATPPPITGLALYSLQWNHHCMQMADPRSLSRRLNSSKKNF